MTIKHFFRLLIASTHRSPRHTPTTVEMAFSGLTPAAHTALMLAQQEARAMGHRYIGTEHFLLGLLALDEGCAAPALKECGLVLEHARYQVASSVAPDPHAAPTRWLSGRSVRVIERAREVALRAGHSAVSSSHLLYALLEEEGIVSRLLEEQGVFLERLVAQASLTLPCAGEGS